MNWTNVTERLPDDDTAVLVVSNGEAWVGYLEDGEWRDLDAMLRGLCSSNVGFIDIATAMFARDNQLLTDDGKPMYYDHAHLSASGAIAIEAIFEPILADVSK